MTPLFHTERAGHAAGAFGISGNPRKALRLALHFRRRMIELQIRIIQIGKVTPMKHLKPLRGVFLLCVLLCLLSLMAYAAEDGAPPFVISLPASEGQAAAIAPQQLGGDTFLFLPAAARLDALTFLFDGGDAELIGENASIPLTSGEAVSLFALYPEAQSSYALTFVRGERRVSFTLLRGEALRAVFITSADADKRRAYVDADKDRKIKGGTFTLLRADGSAVWSGEIKTIKSRGNSTWNFPKKPYQVKLSEKVDLLETGLGAERSGTWILLADFIDPTLLHNRLSFDLAADFGLAYTPHSASVDLYYDGEYRGVYDLCEKTEIAKGRVAIHDLEADVEDANPDISDMDALPRAVSALESGLTYQYVAGLNAPDDLSGGYLLELDYAARAQVEPSWFETVNGQSVVVKSPEYMPEDAMRCIAALYERFENAVYAGGTDPATGTDYRDLVDLDSLVRCFLIMELAEDNDAFASSTFFYKPEDEEKLYAGPVWDFDTGYGTAGLPEGCSVSGGTRLGNLLLHIPSFREALQARWSELRALVNGVVLSADPDAAELRLKSLPGYDAELASSRDMDRVLWPSGTSADVSALSARLARRAAWLDGQIAVWSAGEIPEWFFADVPAESWFYEPVRDAVALGLFEGSSPILFSPETQMTRAMAVTVLHRLSGEPVPAETAGFTDVPRGTWYAAAADWALESGVSDGMGGGRFAPNAKITREQFITMLCRCAGAESAESAALTAFADSDAVSPWARDAMAWAVDSGLIVGSGGRLDPGGFTTRAQAAAILVRFHSLSTGGEE